MSDAFLFVLPAMDWMLLPLSCALARVSAAPQLSFVEGLP
jgi:hypothetical protein